MKLKKFLEHFSNEYKIIPSKINSGFSIRWIDPNNKKRKEVGVMDVHIDGDEVRIRGYQKYIKNVNGYQFIKMSIDYLLSLGYKSISSDNRSEHAARVWEKLKKEYTVETVPNIGLSSNPNYIPARHDKFILKNKIL